MNSGRRDQDVRGEPGGVRPGYGGRALPECRNVVDEVGNEHEDQRRSRQPDHGRTALAMEEQGRQQAEEEDVSGRVRDTCERRPAPTLVQRRLKHDRPEHEQRGKRDDGDIDEVTPVDPPAAGPEQQSQTNREQGVAGNVEHIRRPRGTGSHPASRSPTKRRLRPPSTPDPSRSATRPSGRVSAPAPRSPQVPSPRTPRSRRRAARGSRNPLPPARRQRLRPHRARGPPRRESGGSRARPKPDVHRVVAVRRASVLKIGCPAAKLSDRARRLQPAPGNSAHHCAQTRAGPPDPFSHGTMPTKIVAPVAARGRGWRGSRSRSGSRSGASRARRSSRPRRDRG